MTFPPFSGPSSRWGRTSAGAGDVYFEFFESKLLLNHKTNSRSRAADWRVFLRSDTLGLTSSNEGRVVVNSAFSVCGRWYDWPRATTAKKCLHTLPDDPHLWKYFQVRPAELLHLSVHCALCGNGGQFLPERLTSQITHLGLFSGYGYDLSRSHMSTATSFPYENGWLSGSPTNRCWTSLDCADSCLTSLRSQCAHTSPSDLLRSHWCTRRHPYVTAPQAVPDWLIVYSQ